MTNQSFEALKWKDFATVLADTAAQLEQTGPGTWSVCFHESSSAKVKARADDSCCWLETQQPVRSTSVTPGPRKAASLLRQNGSLSGSVKFCLTPRSGVVVLTAECLLDDEADDIVRMDRMYHVCRAFRRALQALTPSSGCTEASVHGLDVGAPLSVDHEAGEVFHLLCRDTGWPFHVRADGQLAITMDVPGSFCQAFVHRVSSDDFRLCVPLESPLPASATSTHAMGLFLLTASRLVRTARVAASGEAPAPRYRWETVCGERPKPSEFHAALSALSVACRLTCSELPALADESIALRYLKLRGLSP